MRANHFWLWQPTKIPLTWYGASPLNFIAWGFVTLLILGFATPTLIKKQPGSRSAVDLNPFGIWLGAIMLFFGRRGKSSTMAGGRRGCRHRHRHSGFCDSRGALVS